MAKQIVIDFIMVFALLLRDWAEYFSISPESKAKTHMLPSHKSCFGGTAGTELSGLSSRTAADPGNRAPRAPSLVLLAVLSACRSAHRLESPVEQLSKQGQQGSSTITSC